MKIFSTSFQLSVPHVVAVALLLGTGASLWLYIAGDLSEQWGTICSGLTAGLAVASIQFFWGWYEAKQTEHFRRLRIKNVLLTRDDENYYGRLITAARRQILVLGVTSSRFLEDFADEASPKLEKKSLLEALSRGVHVRILVSSLPYLPRDAHAAVTKTKARMNKLKSTFPNYFDFGYFEHEPRHSMVVCDNDLIVGPYFPETASKDSPGVHVDAASEFGMSYVKHFEIEWDHRTT